MMDLFGSDSVNLVSLLIVFSDIGEHFHFVVGLRPLKTLNNTIYFLFCSLPYYHLLSLSLYLSHSLFINISHFNRILPFIDNILNPFRLRIHQTYFNTSIQLNPSISLGHCVKCQQQHLKLGCFRLSIETTLRIVDSCTKISKRYLFKFNMS